MQLTPDECWMTRLCALRNAIVHGDEVPDELWEHQGQHQLSHIHDKLIAALRLSVAEQVGDVLLKLPKSERVFPPIAQEMADRLRESGESPDEPPDTP
ncbi:MAG: hypothetical protein AABM31_04415 [Actinomycetota bacterium]